MLDKTLNLAFSMYHNPGVYALLLGSGISRGAEIPTGWEIVQDIRWQLEQLTGTLPPEDLGYDQLLAELGKTQSERSVFLRKYFEPTDRERETGAKLPTAAHRAIAQLVKDGYIRVILTTNFDRLLEFALQELGIVPDVISSDDMLAGAQPIRHSKITIIKLHGDYRDIRSLNTSEELQNYSEAKNKLLDTIFDEYGLIVCGWSATWDTALRNALYRARSRRYSTYWVEPFELSDAAQELIQHCKAEKITLQADKFFSDLQFNAESIGLLNKPHPLSAAVAAEQVKKMLPYPEKHIELEELFRAEIERAYQTFPQALEDNRSPSNTDEWEAWYKQRLATAFSASEIPLKMFFTLCWYGNGQQHIDMLHEVLKRWTTFSDQNDLLVGWKKMPTLLMMYTCGITAIYKERWAYLRAILLEIRVKHDRYHGTPEKELLLSLVNERTIFNINIANNNNFALQHKLIGETLYSLFREYVKDKEIFFQYLDLLEVIIAVILIAVEDRWIKHYPASHQYRERRDHIAAFWENGGKQKNDWGFLREFFEGDTTKLTHALVIYSQNANPDNDTDVPNYAKLYESN